MTDQTERQPVNPCTRGESFCGQHGYGCPPATDQAALRDRIAEALIAWTYRGKDPEHGGILETVRANAYGRADAVLAVLRGLTLRELEQLYRPNTPPSRPAPRLPDHTVNEEETPTPVRQRADCTELEWAVQERARFERLYTRETVRADLAEQRADTAARDADIYQQRLERLGEGYTEQRKRAEEAEARAEAMERAMESTAADALAHRGCHRDLMAQCQRAERAEAEAERLRDGRAEVPLSPFYEHPECGFRWHGSDDMDVPMRDGQPVCPRCELARQPTVADRAAVLRELAASYERIVAAALPGDKPDWYEAIADVAAGLRRMADETQQPETEPLACSACRHFICGDPSPCRAITHVSAVSDEQRCGCTARAAAVQQPKEA